MGMISLSVKSEVGRVGEEANIKGARKAQGGKVSTKKSVPSFLLKNYPKVLLCRSAI